MTREQIEKAAKEYVSRHSNAFKPETRLEKEIVNAFFQSLIRVFIAGARWRINSVWHNASEIPQHNGLLIAICKDGKAVLCGPNNSGWKTAVKIFHIVKWAYIDDLLPERKEETK